MYFVTIIVSLLGLNFRCWLCFESPCSRLVPNQFGIKDLGGFHVSGWAKKGRFSNGGSWSTTITTWKKSRGCFSNLWNVSLASKLDTGIYGNSYDKESDVDHQHVTYNESPCQDGEASDGKLARETLALAFPSPHFVVWVGWKGWRPVWTNLINNFDTSCSSLIIFIELGYICRHFLIITIVKIDMKIIWRLKVISMSNRSGKIVEEVPNLPLQRFHLPMQQNIVTIMPVHAKETSSTIVSQETNLCMGVMWMI